jgi:adenine-specific DNA-methyltransferase
MPDRPPPPPPARPARAELVWEGKYDAQGRRAGPLRVALPFQTVETVNESAQERQMSLLRETGGAYAVPEWRNRLIWGDKKYVLPSLLAEFAGKVNLIYIDPPFDTGADFSFTATVPDHPDTPEDDSFSFTKEPSLIEHKAYRDTWGRGLDSYLQWFYETAVLLHELLHETGSLYVHLDWHVSHHAKVVLDEIFGLENFRNEIVLPGRAVKNLQQQFSSIARLQVRHDTLLWYSKQPETRFKPYWVQKHDAGNPEGHWHHFWSTADRPTMRYELFGITPKSGQWVWKKERALQAVENYKRYLREGGGRTLAQYWRDTGSTLEFIRPSPDDGKPQYWRAPAELRVADTIWSGIPVYSSEHKYPTEKSEEFLGADHQGFVQSGRSGVGLFCGQRHDGGGGREAGPALDCVRPVPFAIHTTRKRLLAIPDVRPFVVQNLGKYERQAWADQTFVPSCLGGETPAEFTTKARRHQEYMHFILQLYHATPVRGYTWLHGVKAGRMVHVGAVDAPVSVGDVANIAAEFRKAIGTGQDAPRTNGVDVLGWDFAFELNEVAKQQAAAANIQMRFLRIPRDVMDKRAVEQGDVRFFELAALAVEVKTRGREVTLRLTDFVIPPDDVPEEARRAVKHWSQWIDYWAVDWDNQGDTFHNQWQTYRTRKNPKLELETTHTYAAPGEYRVVVKVIDLLGNDTTKTVRVRVK